MNRENWTYAFSIICGVASIASAIFTAAIALGLTDKLQKALHIRNKKE